MSNECTLLIFTFTGLPCSEWRAEKSVDSGRVMNAVDSNEWRAEKSVDSGRVMNAVDSNGQCTEAVDSGSVESGRPTTHARLHRQTQTDATQGLITYSPQILVIS
ncbi:hypothetical protein J6590_032065 [Homalodisca vitripennis]|nr:hypothetical protein J6590_032065 [Homalodisca vitripennis]